ncbi:OmpW family protein [Sphingorhabdus sp.]|jgi:outer membrane protein|uniref:OmpW family protein n=1 Tax=Sphingorhabdus sp. TaxID=1902408 RepID=UPI0037C97F0A
MKTTTKMLAMAAFATVAASPAFAEDPQGKIQVKAFATLVDPSAKITKVNTDRIGLAAGSQTKADTNVTPTVAIEYFLTPNVSVETIAGVTQHDVVGAGALAGAKLISNANIIPATVTAKYHVNLGGGVKPYLGAGPSYFIIFGEEPDATARTLGATRVDLSNELGLALQGGIDFALDDSGLGLSLDAKRYFMNTTARFFAGNALALSTKHELDPWVVSAGISYRF